MDSDTTQSFYEDLGFEIVDIDEREALFFDLGDTGNYLTVSDDDGNLPNTLEAPILITLYDESDSFQWSVTLEDSLYLQELFQQFDSIDELLATLKDIRLENIARADV